MGIYEQSTPPSYYTHSLKQLTYDDIWHRAAYYSKTSMYKTGIEFLDSDLWSNVPLE